jgi:glycerophosphoryl diester phosphodiesterase
MTQAPTPWPYDRLIAHRGAGKLAPENTLAAFRLGHAHGYRMFECDVKLSADGVPYLLHDGTPERTTSGRGDLLATDWATLSQWDAGSWHSPAYAGEPLPTLANIARFVRANGCRINLEIKPVPGDEARCGRLVAAAAARLWEGDSVPPLLSSFSEPALAAARDAAPALPRALLFGNPLPDDWLERITALGACALDAHGLTITPQVVARAKQAGLRVLVYTVNDRALAKQALDLGIDGVITDAVDTIPPDLA